MDSTLVPPWPASTNSWPTPIVAPVSGDHGYVRMLPCPVVFVDRRARNLDADAVVVDDRDAAARAVRHLIAHGHRRIAFIGDGPDMDTARLRLEGYRLALTEAGITEETVLECRRDDNTGHAAAHTTRLLGMPQPPTAIFSANTRCSLGVVPVLHRRDRLDIALVAFGDFPMADSVTPAVTVIDHPPEVIGRLAATLRGRCACWSRGLCGVGLGAGPLGG